MARSRVTPSRAQAEAQLQQILADVTPERLANGHPHQLRVLTCVEQAIILLCSRRAGKTYVCAALLLLTAIATGNVSCLYLALTSAQAKKVWKKTWKPLLRRFRIPCDHSESDLQTTLWNGSTIVFGGTDDA